MPARVYLARVCFALAERSRRRGGEVAAEGFAKEYSLDNIALVKIHRKRMQLGLDLQNMGFKMALSRSLPT